MGQKDNHIDKHMDEYIKEISEKIDGKRKYYAEISNKIWEYAEPRFQEYKSSELLRQSLKEEGFSVRSNLAGEETAFIAEYGSGKPVIGFLGEFDALPGLSQKANATERIPEADHAEWLRSWMWSSAYRDRHPCFCHSVKRLYERTQPERRNPLLRLSCRRECRWQSISRT